MSLDTVVKVTITRQTKLPTQVGFGVPLVMDINVKQSNDFDTIQNFPDDMTGIGFTSSDEAFKAIGALLSQTPRPTKALLFKRVANVVQVDTIVIGGADDGTYTITINAVDFSFIASSDSITAIRDGLVASINGGSEPVTADPVSTDTLTNTSDTAGVGFSDVLTGNPNTNMVLTLTTANVSPSTELQRMRDLSDDFYFVHMTSRTKVDILDLSLAVESLVKIFAYETDEADSKDLVAASDTTSILGVISTANRDRTLSVWTKTSNLGTYPALAWVGKQSSKDPGSTNWRHQTVTGPVADDELNSSDLANLELKNGNIYRTLGNIASFQEGEGKVGSGEFVDIIRGSDFLQVRTQEKVFGLFIIEDKVPYDDGGLNAIGQQVDAIAALGVRQLILLGGDDAPTVEVPTRSGSQPSDIQARIGKGFIMRGKFAGAVNKVEIEMFIGL